MHNNVYLGKNVRKNLRIRKHNIISMVNLNYDVVAKQKLKLQNREFYDRIDG
jgi:hypothetical protein